MHDDLLWNFTNPLAVELFPDWPGDDPAGDVTVRATMKQYGYASFFSGVFHIDEIVSGTGSACAQTRVATARARFSDAHYDYVIQQIQPVGIEHGTEVEPEASGMPQLEPSAKPGAGTGEQRLAISFRAMDGSAGDHDTFVNVGPVTRGVTCASSLTDLGDGCEAKKASVWRCKWGTSGIKVYV